MLNTGLNITKKDYLIGAVIGLFTGILALRVFALLEINFKFQKEIMLFLLPILWALGVWFGGFLGKWIPFFNQFGKFACVGFLNASIDFLTLNFISFVTGITTGLVVGWINIPGFLLATTNGYLWNKLWVFKKDGQVFGDFPKFLAVTIIGLFVNSSLIVVFTTFLNFGVSSNIWLNFSKVAAAAITLIWNFIGYRYFAFKKHV